LRVNTWKTLVLPPITGSLLTERSLAQFCNQRRTTMDRRNVIKAAAGVAVTLPTILAAEQASAAGMGPILAVISHPVKDYAAWRAVYDSAEALRQKAGITGAEVFRDLKDPNIMVIIHRFPTAEAAQAFLNDPGLKEAMTKSGVTAPPSVILAAAV
jgi:quinol monooxygenase YgiN